MPIPTNDEDSQFTGIPADVAAILDEADESGPYAAVITSKSVQLIDAVTKKVVKEVFWHRAGEYGDALQKAVVAAMGQK